MQALMSSGQHIPAIAGLQGHVCIERTQRARRGRRQQEAAPVRAACPDYTPGSQDAIELAQGLLRFGEVLEERVAEYALEPAALEG